MGKKEVFTRIDEELYKKIKEKGYKLSDLIKLGYEYKEKSGNILTEDKIKELIEEFRKISGDIKKTLAIFNIVKEEIDDIKAYISASKSKILSKIFPSKYDFARILDEINDKLEDLKSKL